jgi:cell cycle sensor histidine kinase DivJ
MNESRASIPVLPPAGVEPDSDLGAVLNWHVAWAGAVVLAAVLLWLTVPWGPGTGLALALSVIPAVGLLIARHYDGPRLRTTLVAVWAIIAVLAATLTGALASPLAVWCFTPLVVGTLLGGNSRLSQGAVLSLAAVAAIAASHASGLKLNPPGGSLGLGLGFTGLATTAAGAAAALAVGRRRISPNLGPAFAAAARPAPEADEARAVLDSAPYLILLTDGAGGIERAYGRAPASLAGRSLRGDALTRLASEDDSELFREALLEAAASGAGRFAFRQTDAAGVWLSLDIARLSDSRLVIAVRDISAERAREAALQAARAEAEALAVGKSRFLANMSHELRTPLNAIMGFSDIMRERIFGELSPRYLEYADLIHDAGTHLLDLINDVLDMSKIEAAKYELKLERIDARDPISAALRLMRVQADEVGVTLRGVLPGHALTVDADSRAIKQITLNLISNALKFTPRGGLVTVSLRPAAGAMELAVADTGIGISAADLERLGRPYEQAGDAGQQAKGTGLGLSLVRAFAELHGGEMVIESQLGEGTAVSVRLPVLAMEAAPEQTEFALEPEGAQVIAFKPQR